MLLHIPNSDVFFHITTSKRNNIRKPTKHVLLATTALALSAGVVAADFSTSATAKLTYGNFGTGTFRAGQTAAATPALKAADPTFTPTADFVVTMSGEDFGIPYSSGLTIDETDGPAIGALTLASSGFSITYHQNELSAITTTGADVEDDNQGDLKIADAGNGLTADYTVDTDNDDNPYVANFGYEIAGFTVGVKVDDSTDGNKKGGVEAINTFSVGYTMGDIAIKASADSQKEQDWDASVAYTMGDTVLTFATDEQEAHSIAVKTTLDALSWSAKYIMEDKAKADAVTEVTLGYTMGNVTLGVTYDSAKKGKFGDETQTVVSASYTIGGIVIGAKANDQNEYEVSTAFTF